MPISFAAARGHPGSVRFRRARYQCRHNLDREPDDIQWLIRTVQEVVDKPLCLDSPNPLALAAGLEVTRQLPIINSISGEEHRLKGVLPVVAKHGCRVLALALEGSAISPTCEGRMAIVRRMFEETRKVGVPDENVYVDALVMTVATDNNAANVTLLTMRTILAEYPKAHLTAGLSNISFGLPARTLLNRAFLTLAIEAGLDSMIVDSTDRGLMETMYASTAVLAGTSISCSSIAPIAPGKSDKSRKKRKWRRRNRSCRGEESVRSSHSSSRCDRSDRGTAIN